MGNLLSIEISGNDYEMEFTGMNGLVQYLKRE